MILGVSMMAAASTPTGTAAAELHPISYSEIEGWSSDAHGQAFSAFQRGCSAILAHARHTSSQAMHEACRTAIGYSPNTNNSTARVGWETRFEPRRVVSHGRGGGLFTG